MKLRRHRTNLGHKSTYRTVLVVRHNNPSKFFDLAYNHSKAFIAAIE